MENNMTEEEYQNERRKAIRKYKIRIAISIIIAIILIISEIIIFFYLCGHGKNVWRIFLVCTTWPINYLITIISIALGVVIILYTIPNPWCKEEDMIDLKVKYLIYCISITILFVLGFNLIFWKLIFKI